jgi:hypothetical protein
MPRESTRGPGRYEAAEPEGEKASGAGSGGAPAQGSPFRGAGHSLSETMKFKCGSGRQKAGEPDQTAMRRQKVRGTAAQGVVGTRRKGVAATECYWSQFIEESEGDS